jgi:hypothetical protein
LNELLFISNEFRISTRPPFSLPNPAGNSRRARIYSTEKVSVYSAAICIRSVPRSTPWTISSGRPNCQVRPFHALCRHRPQMWLWPMNTARVRATNKGNYEERTIKDVGFHAGGNHDCGQHHWFACSNCDSEFCQSPNHFRKKCRH